MKRQAVLVTLAVTAILLQGGAVQSETAPTQSSTLYQGLSEMERQNFYHLSIGTQFIPYAWFLHLRVYENDSDPAGRLLKDQVEIFGLIRDAKTSVNPDGLPVGMTITTLPPYRDAAEKQVTEPPRVGFNCAFCHTAVFSYQGKPIRIEGGGSMQYNHRFLTVVVLSMKTTLTNPSRFEEFAKAVLQSKDSPEARQRLQAELKAELSRLVTLSRPDPLEWGYGRFDALGRGGNLVFGKLDPENLRHLNAPVGIPALWTAWDYDWVQWNGAIQHPIARNIGQVIGVGADLFTNPADHLTPLIDAQDPFRSSINMTNLIEVEKLVMKITPPQWPKELPFDRDKADKGRVLYHQRCLGCHEAKPLPEPTDHGQHFRVKMIQLDEVGTDPSLAENFRFRTAETGPLYPIVKQQRMSAAEAVAAVTSGIMMREEKALTQAGIKLLPNDWRACVAAKKNPEDCTLRYMARPHRSVWATPPFLHNDSIPTIYELLSPMEQRKRCFEVKPPFEYDPIKVGLVVAGCGENEPNPLVPTDPFRFDTGRPGNSHAGHEFRNTDRDGKPFSKDECDLFLDEDKEKDQTWRRQPRFRGILGCELTGGDDGERMQLIEYLKTL